MISVAIPAYKARFLADAIKSVLCQTFSDFELIIVNDDSPEDIRSIVDQFKDDRIKYFENKINLGRQNLVLNWNECLKRASGELFVLFSDDDLYLPEFLDEVGRISLKYPNADVFHCAVRIIDESGQSVDFAPLCPEFESAASFIWHRIKGYRLHFASDFCSRTNALRDIGGFAAMPQGWGSDDITWFTLATRGGIGYTQRELCYYRISEITISRSGSIPGKLEALCDFELLMGEILARASNPSIQDHDLLLDVKAELPHWIAKRKADQLVGSAHHYGFAAFIRVMLRWITYRKGYRLSPEVLMRAISGGVKAFSQSLSI